MIARIFLFLAASGTLFYSGIFACSTLQAPPAASPQGSSDTETTSGAAPDAPSPVSATPDGSSSGQAVFTPPVNTRTVVQVTDNDEEDSWGGNNFWPTISRGRVLWQHLLNSGEREIRLAYLNGIAKILRTAPDDVDFMALGSGPGTDDVLATWREDLSETFVNDGAVTSSLGKHNQEENTVADGCLYYRDSTSGPINNEIARYSMAGGHGLVSQASYSDSEPITSGCEAVWLRDGDLVHFDGVSIRLIAAGPITGFDFRNGQIVYGRLGDVFVYDRTAASPASVNVTSDAVDLNRLPKTDGRFVAFLRNPAGGTDQDIVLIDLADNSQKTISATTAAKDGFSLELDQKQVIWTEGGTLYFFDGTDTAPVDASPATSVNEPHLADGLVVWHGQTGVGTDEEIFLMK